MEKTGKAEYLIRESGCGPFQVLMVFFVDVLIKVGTVYAMMFMAFGNYNPGWRCLDDNTTTTISGLYNALTNGSAGVSITLNSSLNDNNRKNRTSGYRVINNVDGSNNIIPKLISYFDDANDNDDNDNETSDYRYSKGSCNVFEACDNIEFDPQTSTIVTEWGLLCDDAWVPSLIISIQMAGILVGSLIAGQLGDTFGRKKILYAALATLGVLSAVSIFAPSWQFRFLIGSMIACLYNLYYILPSEYLSSNWRTRLAALPSWHVGGMLFGVTVMLCKDWRMVHIIGGVYCVMACVPAVWVPESLRWLEVKNKPKDFERVAKKMINMNKASIINSENRDKLMLSTTENNQNSTKEKATRTYTVLALFRKGYRMYSIIIALIWFSLTLIYYSINFGVKAMYGDFYINLIIVYAADIPFAIFPMSVPIVLGRKKSLCLFLVIATASLLTATGFGLWASIDVRNLGTLILALIAKMSVTACLACNTVITAEIYPTVVRSNAVGFANLASRIGGIIAPFLVPRDADVIHVSYGIMGTLCLVCCLISMKLPETENMALKEVFDEDNIHLDVDE